MYVPFEQHRRGVQHIQAMAKMHQLIGSSKHLAVHLKPVVARERQRNVCTLNAHESL